MLCRHCKSPFSNRADSKFCCAGCEAVFALLHQEGLERYYDLASDNVAPAPLAVQPSTLAWLEPWLQKQSEHASKGTLRLDIQGIQCAACVWLLNELYKKLPGAIHLLVNPGVGRLDLRFDPQQFDLPGFVRRVESFGYRLGPALKRSGTDDLTLRLGICAALTLNVMLFSVSFYFGLSPQDGELYRLFLSLSWALSTVAVAVGGWPFFKSAFYGLKSGVLHLDLPVALGIAAVYATSLLQARSGRETLYADTLCTFITLMLLGKWLQRRVVQQNQRWLLEDAGVDGLWCRRIENGALRVVPAAAIKPQETFLVAPKELVPVDSKLLDVSALISREWLNGESAPISLQSGDLAEAGSFNVGNSALRMVATRTLDASRLPELLKASSSGRRVDPFWVQLSKQWASRVLFVASLGFVIWLPQGLQSALSVASALLVVTCPCAIGLAIPLSYEVVQARLRRVGFFARAEDVLDRLRRVTTVILDKTGTLTLNRLELTQLPTLSDDAKDAAYNLSCRSTHPASDSIARALCAAGARFQEDFSSSEISGEGIVSGSWKLGRRAKGQSGTGLFFKNKEIAVFEFHEVLRPSAVEQVETLKQRGYRIWLLSGDHEARVTQLAQRLGLDERFVRSNLMPQDKAEQVRALDHNDTLYLGDGVNDALAFQAAACAGTVSVDRPVMPSRSSFFFVGDSLSGLSQALEASKQLHRVVRALTAASMTYNVAAVLFGLGGLITPLRAAIFMPLSSLSLLLFALFSLRERRNATTPLLKEVPA